VNQAVTHLVPDQPGGVSDYVDLLMSIRSSDSSVRISNSDRKRPKELDADNVLLHYVGYGYAKRGAPTWLLDWIRRNVKQGQRFGVFFHELYAFGSPFSSSFWLSPVQRYLALSLAKRASCCVYNRKDALRWIQRHGLQRPSIVLPVPSNVGESVAFSHGQSPVIVVFGSPSLRAKLYESSSFSVIDWAAAQAVQIHDIGAPLSSGRLVDSLTMHGVKFCGFLSPTSVRERLQSARFGAIFYPASHLEKSGTFAAYAANCVCPVLFSTHERFVTPRELVSCFLSAEFGEALPAAHEQIAWNAWTWYSKHSLKIHVQEISRLFSGNSS
jgi:hypothetical protein